MDSIPKPEAAMTNLFIWRLFHLFVVIIYLLNIIYLTILVLIITCCFINPFNEIVYNLCRLILNVSLQVNRIPDNSCRKNCTLLLLVRLSINYFTYLLFLFVYLIYEFYKF